MRTIIDQLFYSKVTDYKQLLSREEAKLFVKDTLADLISAEDWEDEKFDQLYSLYNESGSGIKMEDIAELLKKLVGI